MKAPLFLRPETGSDIRFVTRCLWSLDPNRHLFGGDFRDFVRGLVWQMLAPYWDCRMVPESSVDEIEKWLKDCPCSAATRRCWGGISREMRQNLEKVRVTAVWSWDYSLWEFARHRFGYGGGSYWSPKTLPPEFSEARKLPYREILESVATSFRRHLDPGTVEGALILWMLWCLDIHCPEQAGKPDPDYLTTYSLSRQLVDEIEDCRPMSVREIPLPVLEGAEKLLRQRYEWLTLAHALARSGRFEAVGRLKSIPIDDINHSGETPLIVAVCWRKWAAARWLLDAGANPSAKSLIREPALIGAVRAGAPGSLLKRFLQKGATPAETDAIGDTALHAAASAGRVSAIRHFEAVPLESRNKLGHTPLYSAVFAMVAGKGSRHAAIKALLAAGAEPDPTSKRGVRVSDFLARPLELGANPRTIRQIRSILR